MIAPKKHFTLQFSAPKRCNKCVQLDKSYSSEKHTVQFIFIRKSINLPIAICKVAIYTVVDHFKPVVLPLANNNCIRLSEIPNFYNPTFIIKILHATNQTVLYTGTSRQFSGLEFFEFLVYLNKNYPKNGELTKRWTICLSGS